MIKILQMIGSLEIGGSQAMIMNIYRNIDREKIQFDFIIDHTDRMDYADEIKALGGKIYTMPTFKGKNILEVKRAWNEFFKTHPEYKIIHSHVRSYASVYLSIAKKYGLKTISHSHNTSNGTGIASVVKKILQYPLRYIADYCFGCSEIAGEWLFGRKVVESDRYFMLKNAVDTKKFRYDETVRNEIRSEFNLGDEFIFGHVGRFHIQKNHEFLLEIFKAIHNVMPNSKLMLVGYGELQEDIENKIKALKLEDSVIMTGLRTDVPELLLAMDAFLFPSKWEGLPVTLVEAQASGLHCLVSDTVTRDVEVSELIEYLPIDKGVNVWVEKVQNADLTRKDVVCDIVKAGFDIEASSRWLAEFYEKLHNE